MYSRRSILRKKLRDEIYGTGVNSMRIGQLNHGARTMGIYVDVVHMYVLKYVSTDSNMAIEHGRQGRTGQRSKQ